jgi:DNA integrity scanning protein DisA with diadenylate cyclase activity
MRYRELMRGVEKLEDNVIRDYAILTLNRTRTLLSNLTFDGLLDIGSISRLILEKESEDQIAPKGFRFMSHLSLTEKEVSSLVRKFGGLGEVLSASREELELLFRGRAVAIKKEMENLREQILSGKIVS